MKKNQSKLIFSLALVAIAMFAFGFALVPIYKSLCQSLGINGKPNTEALAYEESDAAVDEKREVLVQFVATNNAGIPWDFYPKTQQIKIKPGKIAKLAFYAENKTDRKMIVQAIPSITPGIAAKYLKKTECFCFTQQSLNGHEAMDMPLLFHIDKELPKEIRTVTLSYTLFDVTDKV